MSQLTQGDMPTFEVVVRDQDSVVIDITGATATLLYRINGAALVSRGMALIDAPNGIAQYQAIAAELTEGQMKYRYRIVDVGGAQYTSEEEFTRDIRAPL